MSFKKAEMVLNQILSANLYKCITIGDWWGLSFNGYWLQAQDIISPEEDYLNSILENTVPSILDGIDPENVAKSMIVQRNMRKEIIGFELLKDSSLKLMFEGNREMTLTTSTEIVDWQWCFNRSGSDPYTDFSVACFSVGDIRVSDVML